MKDEKRFTYPEAIIVSFDDSDIIVTSGGVGEGWGEDPTDKYQD